MRFGSIVFLSGLLTVVSAHFQLQYPVPRGVFVEDNEPTFCDGYTTAVSNRSEFPLNGGFISINSEHPKFTFGVLLSTAQNPTNFANFSQAVNFFQATGEGPFCLPVDLATAGLTDVAGGINATLQMVFDGGDGMLYQCADVILSSSFTVPSNISCQNSTSTSTSGSSAPTSTSPTASGSPSPSPSTGAAMGMPVTGFAAMLSAFGAILAFV